MSGKARATELLFGESILLNHGSHGPVEHHYFLCGDLFQRRFFLRKPLLGDAYDVIHPAVVVIFFLKLFHNAHGLLHFAFIVEIHFQVNALCPDIVEQGLQFIKRHPAGHDALPRPENFLVKVVPLAASPLWLTHSGRPLNGVELFYFEQRRQVVHGSHAVEMVQGIVDFLALLPDEGLHEAAVVVLADHG